MRRISLSMSYFLLIILLLLCILLTPTQSSNDLIDQICTKTPYSDLCNSVLRSNPSAPASDTKGLALIMANTILSNATNTLNYIEDLIKKTPDPDLEHKLALCAELYNPVVKYTIPQAVDAISQSKFGFANYSVSYSEDQVSACDKKFSGSTHSPVADRNGILQKLLNVAGAILVQLLHG